MTLTKDETYLLTQTWCPKTFLGLMKFLAWFIHKRHDDDEFKLGDLLIKHIYIPPTILLSAETDSDAWASEGGLPDAPEDVITGKPDQVAWQSRAIQNFIVKLRLGLRFWPILEPGVESVKWYPNQTYRGPDVLCEILVLRQHLGSDISQHSPRESRANAEVPQSQALGH